MKDNFGIQIPWKGWKIVRRLGGGGFGTVYEIERELYGDKERAAMKVIRVSKTERFLDDDDIVKNVTKEYKFMLELKGHSNIVNCHDIAVEEDPFQSEHIIFIRMELLTPLREVVRDRVTESEVIKIGKDICKALELCEKKNIIHRDIKPDNIMMSQFGDFKLGDFGIARTMERTRCATRTGTFWYMAPEVARGMEYGSNVDLYSLGMVLYWLLNEYRLPFVPLKDRITSKDMDEAYFHRVKGEVIPEPVHGNSRLKAIVLKALAFEGGQRYQSAKEMLKDLRDAEQFMQTPQKEVKEPQPEKIVRYRAEPLKGMELQHKVFGIYMDTEEIHVKMYINGAARPILTMPALYIFSDVDEVLTGNRAVLYRKCHRDKQLHSVLNWLKESERFESTIITDGAQRNCQVLMKELKKRLDQITSGQVFECVLTVASTDPKILRTVRLAMLDAGFKVLRQLDTGSACAIAKAFYMRTDQKFAINISANDERKLVLASCEKIDEREKLLEMIESTTCSVYSKWPIAKSGYVEFHACDEKFRKVMGKDAASYENLAALAAEGALFQGLRLIGHSEDVLLLDVCPWNLAIEVVENDGTLYYPYTMVINGNPLIPTKSDAISIPWDSCVQRRVLRLYAEKEDDRKKGTLIREWTLDGTGNEAKSIEVMLDLTTDYLSFDVVFKMGKHSARGQFLPENTPRKQSKSDMPAYVPKKLVEEILRASQEFSSQAELLSTIEMDPSIIKGIQMIARQSHELLKEYIGFKGDIQIGAFIEKMITIADNLEYGMKGLAKSTEKMKYLNESGELSIFHRAISDRLLELNVVPVEAEGVYFDPYVHHAMMQEELAGVEENLVTEEIQKGYFVDGRLYRPAKVKVSKCMELS